VSAKSPILLTFVTKENEKFPLIWKTGDDLRQDQLVLQLISLMNKLLLKDGLDLKLTPYRALATSAHDGMLECVQPSAALSKIIAKGDIRSYIEEKNQGNVEEAMENFIKSSGILLELF
jgi:phosphatidylinositol 3-kinase